MIRAVLDTNVVLASQRTSNPQSPNAEIISRWQSGAFVWLFSDDNLTEYLEKLVEHEISDAKSVELIARLFLGGGRVPVSFFHLRHYPVDADDTAFLLTALNGHATHLVTYDTDLLDVAIFYPEFTTCRPLTFLEDLAQS